MRSSGHTVDTRKDGIKPEYNEAIIHIIECQGLRAADRRVFGTSSSDPYVKVKDTKGLIGSDKRTPTIKKNLNPKWDKQIFCFKFNHSVDALKLLVKDEDKISFNDKLGKVSIPLSAFYTIPPDGSNFRIIDNWFNLVEGKSSKWDWCRGKPLGRIHVRICVRFNVPMAIPDTLVPLPYPQFNICLGWDFGKSNRPVDLDASVAALNHNNEMVDYCAFSRLTAFKGAMKHSGDDRTGEGGGDDETITINASDPVFSAVDRFIVVINCYSRERYLNSISHAYIRITVGGKTKTFYSMFRNVPKCSGLVFGQILRTNNVWNFVTVCQPVHGRTVIESLTDAVDICTAQRMHYLPHTVQHTIQVPANMQIGQQFTTTVAGVPNVHVTVPPGYHGTQMAMVLDIPAPDKAAAGAALLHGALGGPTMNHHSPHQRSSGSPVNRTSQTSNHKCCNVYVTSKVTSPRNGRPLRSIPVIKGSIHQPSNNILNSNKENYSSLKDTLIKDNDGSKRYSYPTIVNDGSPKDNDNTSHFQLDSDNNYSNSGTSLPSLTPSRSSHDFDSDHSHITVHSIQEENKRAPVSVAQLIQKKK